MWLFPVLILGTTIVLAIPLGYYLARVFDGACPRWLRFFETRVDTGPQNWKQYALVSKTEAPLGVVGEVEGINVLEMNLAGRERMRQLTKR